MSEIGEMPQMPQQEQVQPRLEDMEEFQKLTPEQQEYLLGLRERIQAEAMNPALVVTRSIDEMGFFEGLKETMKPHFKKQGEIMFKNFKAKASLVLSLIPIVGEGKGFLGINKAKDLPWSQVSFSSFKAGGGATFEPVVRLTSAISRGKNVAVITKGASAVASGASGWVLDQGKNKILNAAFRAASSVDNKIAPMVDMIRPVTAALAGKEAAVAELGRHFAQDLKDSPAKLAKTLHRGEVYSRVKRVAEEAAKIKADTLIKGAKAANLDREIGWLNLVDRIRRGVQKRKVIRTAKDAVKVFNKSELAGLSFAQKKILPWGIEKASQVGNTMPATNEAMKRLPMGLGKLLDLTPDVPRWLSVTTGVLQFLGMHGIDAVSAATQMGINTYQQVKLSKEMAGDILAYTTKRGLRKVLERQQAAAVFEKPVEASVNV